MCRALPDPGIEDDILAAANYMIPICWLALFSPDCLTPRRVPASDGSMIDYLVLQTRKEEGLLRLENFRTRARRRIPALAMWRFDAYRNFLRESRGAWLALETAELWMMDEPAQVEKSFRECLDAVSKVGRWSVFLDSDFARNWRALLIEANVDLKAEKTIESYSLFGGGWLKRTPWEGDKTPV